MATQQENENESSDTSEPKDGAPSEKKMERPVKERPERKKREMKVVTVPVAKLKHFPGNARRGNLDVICESLLAHGLYKPLVVQRSTKYVMAGNNTLKGAKALAQGKYKDTVYEGWDTLEVIYIDCDNQEAVRINLVDNRSNDLATYDMEALSEQLEQIKGSPVGTGFNESDIDAILKAVESTAEDVDLNALLHPVTDDDDILVSFDETPFGDEGDDLGLSGRDNDGPIEPDEEEQGTNFEDVTEELGGVLDLKDDVQFEGHGYWGIPKLKKAMLFTPNDFPSMPLLPWAGFATRKWDDPEQWWFYNYGESTWGMSDITKQILAFYCFDDEFEKWWYYPAKYVAKAINAGIKYAVCPNFTASSLEPHTLNMFAIFRSRWIGRYMQEAGIKVIPDVSWPRGDTDFLAKHVLPSLGQCPVIASQRQTFDHAADQAYVDSLAEGYKMVVEAVKPEKYIIYASTKVFAWVQSLGLKTDLVHIVTRTEMMRNHRGEVHENPLK